MYEEEDRKIGSQGSGCTENPLQYFRFLDVGGRFAGSSKMARNVLGIVLPPESLRYVM
jgi:hypothetical protein